MMFLFLCYFLRHQTGLHKTPASIKMEISVKRMQVALEAFYYLMYLLSVYQTLLFNCQLNFCNTEYPRGGSKA